MTVYVSPAGIHDPHLTADDTEELHLFAKTIGIPAHAYRDTPHPHYTLHAWRRDTAVQAGATTPNPEPAAHTARRNP